MRYIRYACIAIFAIALIAIALANRELVHIRLIPTEMAELFTVVPEVRLPLFLIIYGAILVGLLVGFIWEWLRESGHRRHESQLERENRRLERELRRMREERHQGKDDVLALLDESA
jgi:putative membrane protein